MGDSVGKNSIIMRLLYKTSFLSVLLSDIAFKPVEVHDVRKDYSSIAFWFSTKSMARWESYVTTSGVMNHSCRISASPIEALSFGSQ